MSLKKGEKEDRWMKKHWPDFVKKKSKYFFWTRRGHKVEEGVDVYCLNGGLGKITMTGVEQRTRS